MSGIVLCFCIIGFGIITLLVFQLILNSVFKLNSSYMHLRSSQQELESVYKSIKSYKPFVLHCLQILNLDLPDQFTCDKFVSKKTGFYKNENVTKLREELFKQIVQKYPDYLFETKFENCCTKYYVKN